MAREVAKKMYEKLKQEYEQLRRNPKKEKGHDKLLQK